MAAAKHNKHWSFIACSKKVLYPLVFLILVVGLFLAFYLDDSSQFNRTGNFIIGVGVWMSMRSTLRDGLNKSKNAQDGSPTINGNQLNSNYFNKISFSIGDARLQVHGFIIVILGSFISSYGDKILNLF